MLDPPKVDRPGRVWWTGGEIGQAEEIGRGGRSLGSTPDSNDISSGFLLVIEGELSGGDVRLETIAGLLDMSGRMLHRRAAEENRTFTELSMRCASKQPRS